MAITVYAEASDFADWTQSDPPANITALLRSASLMVAEAIKSAYYDTDDAGNPTDAGDIEALKDATCAQAAAWVAIGIDPNAAGLQKTGLLASQSLDGATRSFDNSLNASVTAFTARQNAAAALCDEAQRILRTQSLMGIRVWTYG